MSFLDGLLGSPNVSQATNSSVSAATGASLFLTAPSVVRTKSGQFKLSSSVCANLAGSTSGGISIQFFSSLTGAIGPTATGVGVNGSAASSIVWIDSPSINVGQSITYSVEVSPTNASTSITLPNKASSIVVAEEGGAPSGSGVIAVSTSGGGGGGGGGALSSLASPFTMPAVGSTVIASMIPGGGAAFQKNNAVNVNVSGAPSNFTVTLVSGDNVTLLNNGGPFNVAPSGTVPAASIVTVASMNAPLAVSAPSSGASLMLGLNGLYNPIGHLQVKSMWEFAIGGAVTQTSHVNAIAYMLANGGVLYSPPGSYTLTSTLTIDGTGAQPFHWKGQFGSGFPVATSLNWGGADGVPMIILQGLYGFCMSDIAVLGGSATIHGPSSCIKVNPITQFSTFCKFERCQYSGVWSAPYWQPSHAYSSVTPDYVLGPDGTNITAQTGQITSNGHLYKCTGSGTSHATWVTTSWPITSGATFSTDGTVTWQEIGPVGSGVLVGDAYVDSGHEASEYVWEQCLFVGDSKASSGWRQVNGGNVKNFQFDHCEWQLCGRGLDIANGSGSYDVAFAVCSDNVETDIYHTGAGTLTSTSLESEGSGRMLYAQGASCFDTFVGANWSGQPLPLTGLGISPFLLSQSMVTLIGGDFLAGAGGPLIPVQMVIDRVLSNGGLTAGGLVSLGNTYQVTSFLGVYRPDGSQQTAPGPDIAADLANPVRIVSIGDSGTAVVEGGIAIDFPEYHGQRFQLSRQQMSQNKFAGEVPNHSVTTYGAEVVGAVMSMTIGYQLLTAAASSQTFTIAGPFNKALIQDVVVDVTTGFATIVTPVITVGRVVGFSGLNVNGAPTGGTVTANAYVTSASIASITGATPIGKASGNQGAALTFPGDMVWGANYAGSSATQWAITITISCTGLVTAATAGSLDLYVYFAQYPGVH